MSKKCFLVCICASVLPQICAQTFNLPNGKRVTVTAGMLQRQRADALVNAANEDLAHGGGLAAALVRNFPDLQRLSNEVPADKPSHYTSARRIRCPVGSACLTRLAPPSPAIIHAVGPRGADVDRRAMLHSAYRQSLELASREGFSSVAFPPISTGIFAYPLEEATTVAVDTIVDFLVGVPTSIGEVVVAVFDSDAARQQRTIALYEQALTNKIAGVASPVAPTATAASTSGASSAPSSASSVVASIVTPPIHTTSTAPAMPVVSPVTARAMVRKQVLSLPDLDRRIKAYSAHIKKNDVLLLEVRKKLKKLQAQEIAAKRGHAQAQKKHERKAALAKKRQALDQIIVQKKKVLAQQAALQRQTKKMRNDLAKMQKEWRVLFKKQSAALRKKQAAIEKRLKNKKLDTKTRKQLGKQLQEIKRTLAKK